MNLFACLLVVCFIFPVFGQNFCSVDADCKIESTKCNQGLCICEVGKVLDTYGKHCLEIAPGIGSDCTDSTQCTSLIAGPAECNSEDKCSCAADHVYFNNKCVKYANYKETCNEDKPCFDGVDLFALKCEGGKCVCNDGYYERKDVGCRASAKGNGECFLDIDCEDETTYCKYKLDTWGPLGNCTDAPTASCENDDDCITLENAFCATNKTRKCFCNHGFEYDKNINKCVAEKNDTGKVKDLSILKINPSSHEPFNIKCTQDTDCSRIRNSFCAPFRGKCTCKDSFIYDKYSGHCVRGLGAQCLNTKDESIDLKCGVKYSTCNKENFCQCPKYFIYSPYSDKCFKPTREFGVHSCGSNENCYSFGPHAVCKKADETKDLIATCSCSTSSEYDKKIMYCVPTKTGGDQCKNNCEDKLHSECKNNKCVCKEKYLDDGIGCLPDIGSACSLAEGGDCVIKNADCNPVNKICECIDGTFQNGPRECLKDIVDPAEEECESDNQCIRFYGEGGICLQGNCTCVENYAFDQIRNKCILKRDLGEQCTTITECRTILNSEHVKCLSGKCQCDYDFKYSEEHAKCVYNSASALLYGKFFFIVLLIVLFV